MNFNQRNSWEELRKKDNKMSSNGNQIAMMRAPLHQTAERRKWKKLEMP